MTRKILAYISDTQTGHDHGLCNPKTPLKKKDADGEWYTYYPQLNEIQKYLWWLITSGISAVHRLAGSDEIILIHGGDLNHGNKHIDSVFMKYPANQIRLGFYCMLPWFEVPNIKRIRYLSGTPAHEFGDDSATDMITEWTKHVRPDLDTRYLDHGLADIDGFLMDYEHHAPSSGIRTWTKGNVARHYLTSLMLQAMQDGDPVPDLYLRAHTHEYVEERRRLGEHVSWLVINPAVCMPDAWTRQILQGNVFKVRNGITAFEIIDGELVKIHPFHMVKDQRTRERWK